MAIPLFLTAAACHPTSKREPAKRVVATPKPQTDYDSIDNSDLRPQLLDPPPMLADEAPAPKPLNLTAANAPAPMTAKDDEVRAALPFAPAIAMDPVDGSKVSIRADSPKIEIKNKIYYFSSESNKSEFAANPDQYMKGAFARL